MNVVCEFNGHSRVLREHLFALKKKVWRETGIAHPLNVAYACSLRPAFSLVKGIPTFRARHEEQRKQTLRVSRSDTLRRSRYGLSGFFNEQPISGLPSRLARLDKARGQRFIIETGAPRNPGACGSRPTVPHAKLQSIFRSNVSVLFFPLSNYVPLFRYAARNRKVQTTCLRYASFQ